MLNVTWPNEISHLHIRCIQLQINVQGSVRKVEVFQININIQYLDHEEIKSKGGAGAE